MSGTWPRRLAYRTGPTKSPRAPSCLAHLSPNTLLNNTNPVPARATRSHILRHTQGRTLPPVPNHENDLSTIENIRVIGRVPTRNPVRDHMQQGPIPSRSPLTLGPIHMLYTNPRHLCPCNSRSQFLTCIQHRVVHGHFPPRRIKLCITRTTHRVGGLHTSSVHPPWEVFLHRCGCTTQSRRPNVPNRYLSACSRVSDPGGIPLRAPRQNPSTHLQGGTGEGVASELTALFRFVPVRHRLFIPS